MTLLGKSYKSEDWLNKGGYTLPVVVTNKHDEISLKKSIVISVLLHPTTVFLVWLGFTILLLLGFHLSLFDKPEPKMRDIEFVLVDKEDIPINKHTKYRADRNSRAGGIHNPKKPVSMPSPEPAKAKKQTVSSAASDLQKMIQKQQKQVVQQAVKKVEKQQQAPQPKQVAKPVVKQQTQQRVVQQPKQIDAPKALAPRPASTPSAPRVAQVPKSNFQIPTPKVAAPKVGPAQGGPVAGTSQGTRVGGSGSSSGTAGRGSAAPSFAPARSAYGAFEGQPVTLSEDEQLDQEIKSAQELFGSIYGDEHRFTVEDCTFEELNIEEDIALMISTKGANPCEFEKINVKEGVEDFYIIEKDYDDAATEEKGKIKELNFESNLSDFAMVGAVVEDVKYDEKADFRFVYDEETTELPSEVQEKVKEELDAKDVQYTGILDDKNVISGSKYYISFPRNLYLTTFDDICIYFFTKESIEEATADPYSNRYVVYGRNALKTTNITYDEFGCEHFDIVNGLYIPFNPDRTVVKDYHVYQRRNAQAISGLYFELTDDIESLFDDEPVAVEE